MQKTTMLKKEAIDQSRVWYHIDASGLILGKLAVAIADLLRGKNKVNFTSHVDCGDHVIVTNANKVILSKDKNKKEFWYSHSGYIGGLRKRSGQEMIDKYPEELINIAVKGMIPKNRLGRQIIKKLHVYRDGGIDHSAQKPIEYKIKG